ncbi:MAG TPA: response regulator, partial [Acidimicrobiia bacterium]|nr:response regulator [Acidimicrobiia bacterium]
MSPSPATRALRHELLNQVNHIVGYAELILEDLADGAGPADPALTDGLAEVCSAGREVQAAVTAILDPAGDRFDAPALQAALAGPLQRVVRLAGDLAGKAPEEAAEAFTRISDSAARAGALASGSAGPAGVGVEAASSSDPQARADVGEAPAASADLGLVLVVDDDSANRDVLARRLRRLGYTVCEAENGRQALEMMATQPVDLVLLDLNMPDLDGYAVLEARHADPALRDIPTIMISASADMPSVVRCIEMGAEDHLGKPFDPVLLQARVGACLEKKRLRDQERALMATVSHQAEQLAEWNVTLEARVAEQIEELGRMARLRRFLSPQLADLVVSKGDEGVLSTHRRDIAVLFVDVSGFTSFSETAEPEDVMAVLREFHEELGRLVAEFEATVGFFAGDGMMVFFNDPLPCVEPADRALRMAVAMRERLGALAQQWRKRGHALGFAIGVSYGYATLGEMGFEGRYEYGVIGSVVNLAARLCDRAEPGQILISARAKAAVEDVADLEEVGEVSLKGFHAPVRAF